MQDIITFISNHLLLSTAAGVLLILLFIVEFIRARRNIFRITPAETVQLINRENAVIVDIRSFDDYQKGHIIDAISLPSHDLKENSKKLEKFKTKPIIIVCHAGIEAQKIAATLLNQGYNAYYLAGGMRAWLSANLPSVKE